METQTKNDRAIWMPCIENKTTGRCDVPVAREPMTYEEAADYLRQHHRQAWRNCDASVQLFEQVGARGGRS